MAQQTINLGTVANDGTGDPIRDAFDKCNDNFTELYAGLVGLLDFKGSTDTSANPNYPAASKGDFYIVSVAGKIGGGSGTDVELGDAYFATADNAGGDQATVGTSWTVIQGNITGSIGVDVQDEGVAEATGATTLNFTGAGVTATDVGGGVVDVAIAGGGGVSVAIEDEGVEELASVERIDFTGAGVSVSVVGSEATVNIPGGGSFSGAKAIKSADQNAANYSAGSVIALNSEAFDTGGFHDPVTNNSRLTIPSGVAYVNVTAAARMNNITSGQWVLLMILKNGTSVVRQVVSAPVTVAAVMVATGPIACVATDYFEAFLQVQSDTSIDVIASDTFLALEVLE